MQSLLQRTTAFLTPSTSSTNLSKSSSAQPSPSSNPSSTSSSSLYIFPTVEDPSCVLDCSTCTTHYPPKFSIDESDVLYGHINGWSTHLLIATGKSDWVRDVADEKGSVMEGIGKLGLEKRGEEGKRCMVSACNMPVPDYGGGDIVDEGVVGEGKRERERERGETEVLVLPKWEIVEGVRPSEVRGFMEGYVERVATTMDPVSVSVSADRSSTGRRGEDAKQLVAENGTSQPSYSSSLPPSDPPTSPTSTFSSLPPQIPTPFPTRPCPHRTLILLCSQKTRDARCGQSAPLLRREFERHLRPLGLYRDLHDERPGGVGIYFISHVGGHKYAANVMIYRRGGSEPERIGVEGEGEGEGEVREEEREGELRLVRSRSRTEKGKVGEESRGEAMQCIWLARVRPEDCEAIVRYTVLQGRVVRPERHLRGGFDRGRGLTSW